MPLPPWAADYIGIPYVDKGRSATGVDCWGLVVCVYREVFQRALPDCSEAYTDGEDWPGIAAEIERVRGDGWQRTEQPRMGDVVVLAIAGRPWHCGVMLNSLAFLHAAPGDSVKWDRLDNHRWNRRIEGIYRHD
ncbi:C40 family peptidase [Dyella ginsengisoli]|uniref:C40 family peptidase n=1 Tax=Dyella ginsengisoli TaxID=363848 RepID=A0ABW8JVV7_9GAMM